MKTDEFGRGARRAARSEGFERGARFGHVVSGVLHLLIGMLAIAVAFGSTENIDQSGALATLAERPGGRIALWVLAVGFVAMALWRVVEALWGGQSAHARSNSPLDRVKALGIAAVYIGLSYSTIGFAVGAGRSSGEQNSALSARLMQSLPGKALLIVAAVVLLSVGAYHVYKGVTRGFLDDLRAYERTGARRWIEPLAVVGYVAKGLTIVGVGALVVIATVRSNPEQATGLDGALKTLGAQPFGAILLICAGTGVALYGLYCFVMARYAKM
ncbi:DUF1206 domain-containing protein [Rhodococcus sp. NPDC060086]|uniref:DUF1206 domain-containing protein n=1 Tax=Rhodococcus sp. NPDC060086 TaxID=3347055 RepID=UPI0036637CE4